MREREWRTDWAPYMTWAKQRPVPQHDLAGSNLLACTLGDLPGATDVLALTGPHADGYVPLLEAIGARYGTDPDRVATAPGASGANFLALAALVRAGEEVLVEGPAYDPLLGILRLLGARIRRFERRFEDGFDIDPERLSAALTPATRVVVITSPHNPTGALVSAGSLAAVAERAEANDLHVLVDEVYLDAVYRDRPHPAALLSPRFLSTSSLTKAYGLSDLRAGWVLAAAPLAEAVRRVRDVVDGVGAFPAERLAWLAFQQLDRLEQRARGILVPNLERLAAFVEGRPELEWVRPLGGTVAFPRFTDGRDADPFVERVRERGTALVPGRFFALPHHFRIAFGCSPETLEAGLETVGRVLDDL